MAAQGHCAVKEERERTQSERVCKLVLVGDVSVGKTSLVSRFIQDIFQEHPGYTLRTAFATKKVIVGDATVKFQIWDTAGEEKFHSLAPMYYRGAQAAIVVYDITDMESFVRARSWVQELQRYAKPNIVIALAGNKADLKGSVDREMAQLYADENELLFMETSAKTDMNVSDIFMELAKKIPKDDPGHERPDDSQEPYVSGHKQSRQGGRCCKK